jgi:hypothetical protein
MLSNVINKIRVYFKDQRQQQELRELFRLDYRMEKELMAISKAD